MRDLRYKLSPWEGEDHFLPQPPSDWDVEEVDDDVFGDVHAVTYVDDDSLIYVTVDFRPWLHGNKKKINFTAKFLGVELEGDIPLAGYEKTIPKLLSDLQKEAREEESKHIEKLDGIDGGSFWENLGVNAGDLDFLHAGEGEEQIGVSFSFPVEVLSGQYASETASINYIEGSDYEGAFGVVNKSKKYGSISDIKKILREAKQLWEREKK